MPVFDRAMYLSILAFFLDWIAEDPGDTHERLEQFEAFRETVRSILSVTGVHRMTSVLAEMWQLCTALKIHGTSTVALASRIVPIEGAAPSSHPSDLHSLGLQFACCSILEEETATMLDWLDDLECAAEVKGRLDVLQWLQDLRFVISAAHFGLVHRAE